MPCVARVVSLAPLDDTEQTHVLYKLFILAVTITKMAAQQAHWMQCQDINLNLGAHKALSRAGTTTPFLTVPTIVRTVHRRFVRA